MELFPPLVLADGTQEDELLGASALQNGAKLDTLVEGEGEVWSSLQGWKATLGKSRHWRSQQATLPFAISPDHQDLRPLFPLQKAKVRSGKGNKLAVESKSSSQWRCLSKGVETFLLFARLLYIAIHAGKRAFLHHPSVLRVRIDICALARDAIFTLETCRRGAN